MGNIPHISGDNEITGAILNAISSNIWKTSTISQNTSFTFNFLMYFIYSWDLYIFRENTFLILAVDSVSSYLPIQKLFCMLLLYISVF